MSQRPSRRRSPPLEFSLALGVVVVAVAACAAAGVWAWQQAGRIEVLQAELDHLEQVHQATETQFFALQSTATALEERVGTLEASDPAQQLAALRSSVETANSPEQIADLQASLSEMQVRVGGFQAVLDDLTARMKTLETSGAEAEQHLPPEVRLSVARQRQSHSLSCESSAASMAAQYHGVPLSEAEVLAALPLNDNPHLGFRGNVDGPTGSTQDYGVYAGPIQDILNSQGLHAWSIEGGLDGIREAIARSNPVIAWVTYDCQPGTPMTTTADGQEVTLVPDQHVVLVTGYNTEGVWANDPWDGQEDFYRLAEFERALSYFGDMAIEVAAP